MTNRPSIRDENLKEELALRVAEIVHHWANGDWDRDDCADAARKAIRWGAGDGYELAKEFEECGFHPDAMLVDELDSAKFIESDITKAAVKKWVSENKIELPLKDGDIVEVTVYGEKQVGEIVKLYDDEAKYGVWVEASGKPKGTSHYIINYEDATLVTPQTTTNGLQ
jgi:hypothetical protein